MKILKWTDLIIKHQVKKYIVVCKPIKKYSAVAYDMYKEI